MPADQLKKQGVYLERLHEPNRTGQSQATELEMTNLATWVCLTATAALIMACTSSPPTPESTATPVARIENPAPQTQATETATVATVIVLEPPQAEGSPTLTPQTPLTKIQLDGSIIHAQWAEDGQTIDMALDYSFGIRWRSYDMASGQVRHGPSPLKYDPTIWQRLGVPEPPYSPELKGLISPSGERIIYQINSGNMFTPEPPPNTEIWIATRDGQRKTKIYQRGYQFGILEVSWFDDEDKALVLIGAEGPAEFVVVTYSQGSAEPLGVSTEAGTAFSPASELLAYTPNLSDPLTILSLKEQVIQTVDTTGFWPTWSANGERLYYWWGKSYDSISEMRAYDVVTGQMSKVIDKALIAPTIAGSPIFIVSPQEDYLAFLGPEQLWLMALP